MLILNKVTPCNVKRVAGSENISTPTGVHFNSSDLTTPWMKPTNRYDESAVISVCVKTIQTRVLLSAEWLTDQSGQRAVGDGWRELDNDEVLVLSELPDLHAFLRHHVQLLQGVGLLRVPDRSNHIWQKKAGKKTRLGLVQLLQSSLKWV